MTEKLELRFDGGRAVSHQLPLLEGGESISNIGLCFARSSHYLINGKVRFRAPYDSRAQLVMRPPQSGSVVFDALAILSHPGPVSMGGQIGLAVTSGLLTATLIWLISNCVGDSRKPPEEINELVERRPGDFAALRQALRPPLKRAHNVVNNGSHNITIIGDHARVVLNADTKKFLLEMNDDHEYVWMEASVARLNANDRSGGAFFPELGRVVSIDIAKNMPSQAVSILLDSHSRYFLQGRDSSSCEMLVQRRTDPDGEILSFQVRDARRIEDK